MQEHLKDLRAGGRPMTAKEKLQRENEKLQNNWNELKKYARENLYFHSGYQGEDLELDLSIKYLLDKMKELEGNNE